MSRRWFALMIVLVPFVAGLALQIALGLVVVHPPALGWIGLGIAAIVLGGIVAVLFTDVFSHVRLPRT